MEDERNSGEKKYQTLLDVYDDAIINLTTGLKALDPINDQTQFDDIRCDVRLLIDRRDEFQNDFDHWFNMRTQGLMHSKQSKRHDG